MNTTLQTNSLEAKIAILKKSLERNNFEVFIAENKEDARRILISDILPQINPKTVSYADSKTMIDTGVLDYFRSNSDYEFIDTFNPNDSWKEQIYKRKEALFSDLFLTGTNAITLEGDLINMDMVGNRVAALTFGPRKVVLFIGINKITENMDAGMKRVKEIACIENAKRHTDLKVPCQKTNICTKCKSPDRLCNTWTITKKSYPKHRIKIILIKEVLGF